MEALGEEAGWRDKGQGTRDKGQGTRDKRWNRLERRLEGESGCDLG